ncbi:MAG TPA: hypothetical protein VEZ26_01605, partial [Sphingomonadaceae bacterium]|nr:hypothetical protein [Sphingomonadaceae bacterium]
MVKSVVLAMMKISFASITGFVGTGAFFGSTFSVAAFAGLAAIGIAAGLGLAGTLAATGTAMGPVFFPGAFAF